MFVARAGGLLIGQKEVRRNTGDASALRVTGVRDVSLSRITPSWCVSSEACNATKDQ